MNPGSIDTPEWYGGRVCELGDNPVAPVDLIEERRLEDLLDATLRYLSIRLEPDDYDDDVEYTLLEQPEDGNFRFHSELDDRMAHLSAVASWWCGRLLEDGPRLGLAVEPPTRWLTHPPVRWTAFDPTGVLVSLEHLSRAQRRWASFAIQIALREQSQLPILMLLDEPEAALHRRAERHLVQGLVALADELGATVVIATHSPAFLQNDQAQLVHVSRGAEGAVTAERMDTDLRSRAIELGLDLSDLLQFCRLALLVEGEHELIIFDELFREEFAKNGIEPLALRGASNLKNASDAQLLFRFTNAELLVVLDNEDSARINDIWGRACAAQDNGDEPFDILREFGKGGWSSEAKFLQEYCSLALHLDGRNRVRFGAMRLPDIIDYLPIAAIAPKAVKHGTWSDLRERHGQSDTRQDFKSWMRANYDAKYDEETVRAAVRTLDHIPEDFTRMLVMATRSTSTSEPLG